MGTCPRILKGFYFVLQKKKEKKNWIITSPLTMIFVSLISNSISAALSLTLRRWNNDKCNILKIL